MSEIANQLSRSRATLYRELTRNTGGSGYRPKQAQQFPEQRRAEKVQPLKMTPKIVAYIEAKLRLQWSSEQIAGYMEADRNGPGLVVSHETIYRHVWDDKRAGGTWYTQLWQGHKKRRKRRGSKDSRGNRLNTRPRKCLGFKPPDVVYLSYAA